MSKVSLGLLFEAVVDIVVETGFGNILRMGRCYAIIYFQLQLYKKLRCHVSSLIRSICFQ